MNESAILKATNSPGARFLALLPRQDWIIVGWVAAIKVLLFVFGAKSCAILDNKRLTLYQSFEIWSRWDALIYLRLARVGYHIPFDLRAWPLYPWCIRFAHYLTGSYFFGALIISGIASFIAAVLLRRLVRVDYSNGIAQRAVWFFLIFPTAYILHVGYTESFFLALALGCFLAARTDRWWLAAVLGTLSCMTRANGLVLIPALLVEAATQYFSIRQWRWRWLWIAIIPLGCSVYLWLNWRITGDPFAFVRMRRDLSATSVSRPWYGIRETIGNMNRDPSQAEMVGAQELYFVLLGLAGTIVSWFKLRPLYAVWMTGNWLGIAAATFIESAPRYTLTMFPLFILFALLTRNRFWYGALTVWSIFFFALFASLFARGWWAF